VHGELRVIFAGYAAALAAAAAVWSCPIGQELWARAGAAGLAATLVLWAVGAARGNPSVFDPFWSVAPPAVAAAWAGDPGSAAAVPARQGLVVALVWAWGLRLTWHWWQTRARETGEDWRYTEMRRGSGRWFPLVNLVVIHVLPAGMLGAACLAMYPALVTGTRPLGPLDAAAAGVTLAAILLEASADRQMRAFRAGPRAPGEVCSRGWWGRSRHPNYLGELLFWCGLGLCSLAAEPAAWATATAGPLVVAALLTLYSAPALDRRMLARYPGYAAYARRVPGLVPRPWR
jgi:steroid 5-alpha reductase family enzyme